MVYIYALIPIIVNIYILYDSRRRYSLSLAFFLAMLITYTIPNIIHPYYELYSEEVYIYSSIISSLFLIGYVFFVGVLSKSVGDNFHRSYFDDDGLVSRDFFSNNAMILSVVFFVFSLFLLMSIYGFSFSKMIYSSWGDFRNNVSLNKMLAMYLLYPASGILLICIVKRNYKILSIVLLGCLFFVFVLKTRSFLIALLAPWLIYEIAFKKWGLKKIVTYALLLVTVLGAYSLSRNVRHLGTLENITDIEFKLDTQEFELIDNVYYLIDNQREFMDANFNDLTRFILLPIPTSLLDFDKPTEVAKLVWNSRVGVLGVNGSVHPTFIGNVVVESYYFGWLVYALFIALFFFFTDVLMSKITSARLILFSISCGVSFFLARGAFYNGMSLMIFGFVIVIGAELLFKVRLIKQVRFK
ncbi:O-antigen polymerase [Vibrio parahaemolyticus]|uniref:O-antigen polymerase n=2 Tax=Vibrio parahaemolyticus TaxID=670 RepID=UPI00084B5BCD|nr:O-antigen polymerase [Vibrio parahaemolyticus]ELB2267747.1 oligosaccharide repeat unit polymerase [Vibrio parahaemolyticus]MBE4321328.1 oligosaccharide repeat unit polymerase [Vibrio parahaemolyticus]MBM5081328.1 oligosaccharide repeat unit polymerase [Vibrio parahaemolyticus]ODZ91303.1 hypothetical protein BBM50_09850 [Vibrio parahaemolyticus]ODZ97888.1 hypothetical protein BBM51_16870 [Vibrio parahaemolyticus]